MCATAMSLKFALGGRRCAGAEAQGRGPVPHQEVEEGLHDVFRFVKCSFTYRQAFSSDRNGSGEVDAGDFYLVVRVSRRSLPALSGCARSWWVYGGALHLRDLIFDSIWWGCS